MRVLLLTFMIIMYGCGKRAPTPSAETQPSNQPVNLDKLLEDPQYASEIKRAEQDLPDDKWSDEHPRTNLSRENRELNLALKILSRIQPQLKRMDVVSLVRSLKVYPRTKPVLFSGVAYEVYTQGNGMILGEIQSRPASDLQTLDSLADPEVEVWEGAQGSGDTLAEIINYRILKKPLL